MPQMFPMNWMILFYLIIALYLLSFLKIFYMANPSASPNIENTGLKSLFMSKWMW